MLSEEMHSISFSWHNCAKIPSPVFNVFVNEPSYILAIPQDGLFDFNTAVFTPAFKPNCKDFSAP